jgi:hypothetical protein
MAETQPKAGVKTSEFWTAMVGSLAMGIPAVLTALAGNSWVAAILGAGTLILPAIYIVGRAILKSEAAKITNIIPDKWEPRMDQVLTVMEVLATALEKVKLPKPTPADEDVGDGD